MPNWTRRPTTSCSSWASHSLYNNHYEESTEKLREYQTKHPDDYLAALCIFYNRFFESGHGKALKSVQYHQLLAELTTTIAAYEKKDCHGINFATFGRSLDCEYVGAALWSLKLVLRGEVEGWIHVGEERRKFADYAERSVSPQTLFLLGVYEYKISQQGWPKRLAARTIVGAPTDRDHAVAMLLKSLKNNESFFADEARLALLGVEKDIADGKNPCNLTSRGKSQAVRELVESYPPRILFDYLRSRYPEHKDVRGFAEACKKKPMTHGPPDIPAAHPTFKQGLKSTLTFLPSPL